MRDLEERKPSISQTSHPRPGQSRALAATPKRHEPMPDRLGTERVKRPLIARHAVVVGVPAKDAGKPAALLRDGLIAAAQQLAPQSVQLHPRPLRAGDARNPEASLPGPRADGRNPKKPERLSLAETPLTPWLSSDPPKPDQPRLLGIQPQAEPREPVA